MIKSFRLISILLACILFASCSRNTYPLKTGTSPIISVGNEVQKYNMALDFAGKHFNGMLIAKKMNNGEIRIVASTMFGLTIFDFGLEGEDWMVYSCIEPMRKERILKLFEKDFKFLFLQNREVKKIEEKEEYTKFVTGGGISKGVIHLTSATSDNPEKVQIKHSWLRLTIKLEKMNENNATE
ncbi:hypothetical protein JGH11_04375 [Dysgonomonas sp. Marseille-P4677]|uniref:hypothetical protein n=1 Tax=Dysgonomonas sp. Marseille-P4677 TaxID=2364790 RepID=UPI0019146648|nr:hypothetical protein [Dysgonomonas sp. Marseille-P4677]MBK5720102.1 hypothetical protein [Dysgonomonas sp. Marseille-P4677]